MRRALVGLLFPWALPAVAAACPYCAPASDGGRAGYVLGTLVLLLMPAALVGALVLWLRRGFAASQRGGAGLSRHPSADEPTLETP